METCSQNSGCPHCRSSRFGPSIPRAAWTTLYGPSRPYVLPKQGSREFLDAGRRRSEVAELLFFVGSPSPPYCVLAPPGGAGRQALAIVAAAFFLACLRLQLPQWKPTPWTCYQHYLYCCRSYYHCCPPIASTNQRKSPLKGPVGALRLLLFHEMTSVSPAMWAPHPEMNLMSPEYPRTRVDPNVHFLASLLHLSVSQDSGHLCLLVRCFLFLTCLF